MQVDCGAVSHFTLNHSIWNVGIHLNTPYCLPLAGHYCCFISHIHTARIIQKAHTAHTLVCGLALDFLLLHTLAGRCRAPAHNVLAAQRLLYVFIWSGDALLNVIIEWPPRKDTVAASEIYSPLPILLLVRERGIKRRRSAAVCEIWGNKSTALVLSTLVLIRQPPALRFILTGGEWENNTFLISAACVCFVLSWAERGLYAFSHSRRRARGYIIGPHRTRNRLVAFAFYRAWWEINQPRRCP